MMLADLRQLATFLRNWRLSADELNALQERKLAAIVRHAYEHVAYYRTLFRTAGLTPHDIRRVEDLRHVPLTTKAQLRAAGVANITAKGVDLAACIRSYTSGSTGEPFPTFRTRREAASRHLVDFRALLLAGLRPRDRFLSLGPEWTPSPRWHHRLGLYRTWALSRLLPLDEQIRRVAQIRPDVVWIYPSLLRSLLHRLDFRLSAITRPRVLITGAEVVDDVLMDRVRADVDVETFNFYGAVEVGRIAHECRAHTGLHVASDNVLLESLNGGVPAKVNEHGLAVVTSLTRFTMPIIRYRLEDRCMWLGQACGCGSDFPMIGPPQGRSWEMIHLPSGALMSPLVLNVVLRRLDGIDQYRVIQESRDHLVVELVSRTDLPSASLTRLASQLKDHFPEPVRVDVRRVDYRHGDALKFKTYMSRVAPPDTDRA